MHPAKSSVKCSGRKRSVSGRLQRRVRHCQWRRQQHDRLLGRRNVGINGVSRRILRVWPNGRPFINVAPVPSLKRFSPHSQPSSSPHRGLARFLPRLSHQAHARLISITRPARSPSSRRRKDLGTSLERPTCGEPSSAAARPSLPFQPARPLAAASFDPQYRSPSCKADRSDPGVDVPNDRVSETHLGFRNTRASRSTRVHRQPPPRLFHQSRKFL